MKRIKHNNTINQKLHKDFCEVCCCTDKETLQHHHIVEQTEVNTSNNSYNYAVLCSNCHNLFHLGDRLKIIGVYPSTEKHGRTLVYELDGISNVPGITEPYFKYKNPQMKLYNKDNGKK